MSWQRVRGHEQWVEAFNHAVARGRLAHAYLFVGPSGIGKRLFAGELAKALLCEGRPASGKLEACDTCPACILVDAGTHPDFFTNPRPWLDEEEKKEVNVYPIHLMRAFCDSFALKSARGRGKVAILDDADDLSTESANCFLKTLEEPPPRSVFILVGTRPDLQRETVVSRCQVVRFAPLSEADVIDFLLKNGVEDKAHATRLARLSGGSPGQALALADAELWKFRRLLLEGLTKPRPDSVALAKAWTQFVEEAGKETASQRRRAGLVLRLLIEFLHDALALALDKSPWLADPDDLPFLQNLSNRLGGDRLLDLLERCLEAEFHLDRYVQLALVLEGLLDALGQELVRV
jgi:DNA polymerase-3 subunit delta'